MFHTTRPLAAVRASAAALLIAISLQTAHAATVRTSEVIDVKAPTLVDSTTTIVHEGGKTYEETVKKYQTETITRTTEKTSYTFIEKNTAKYDYDVWSRFYNTTQKSYNFNNLTGDNSSWTQGTSTLSWGANAQSSYSYTARNGRDVQAGNRINLGMFTHRNNKIFGGIDDTMMDVYLRLYLEDGSTKDIDTAFFINHAETWDWLGGDWTNLGDTSEIQNRNRSISFSRGDTDYTFTLQGFYDTWGRTPTHDLLVAEGSTGRVSLFGILTSTTERTAYNTRFWDTSSYTHTYETMRMEIAPVPLPASAVLLLAGLGGLGALRRWKRAA